MSIKKNLIDNKKINAIRFKSFFDKKGNSILEAIYNQQQEYFNNDEEPPHVLIYIDDMYDPIMTERFGIFNIFIQMPDIIIFQLFKYPILGLY